jgi:hypothetical protein
MGCGSSKRRGGFEIATTSFHPTSHIAIFVDPLSVLKLGWRSPPETTAQYPVRARPDRKVNGSGQECPLYTDWRTVQWRSEHCDFVVGLERGIDAGSAVYLVAEILAVVGHMDRIPRDSRDRSHAALVGVV